MLSSNLTSLEWPKSLPLYKMLLVSLALFLHHTTIADLAADAPMQVRVLAAAPSPCDASTTAREGDVLRVHYTGVTAKDGVKFDSSLDRGEPLVFVLGQKRIVQGWDQGLVGTCVGEQRRLTIPSGVGFGGRGLEPNVPGGATVVYDIELLAIVDREPTEAEAAAEAAAKAAAEAEAGAAAEAEKTEL